MDKPLPYDPDAPVRCFECIHFRRMHFRNPESVGSCRLDPYLHSGLSSCDNGEREVSDDE